MKVIAIFDIENDRIFDYSCDLHVWNEFGDVRLVKENALLRPLPKPKEANHCADEEFALLDRMYRCGFNACLEEITGETE